MDGAVGYGFVPVSEQSAHEVVSGIRDAVNRTNDAIILVLICSSVAVLNTQTASVKFTTQKFNIECWAASVR
jgi:hypothetical protein